MRVGYYWLAKSEEPLSQDSPEVVKFFEELIENDMIEFSEPKKESSLVGRHNTKELRSFTDKAKENNLSINEYIKYKLKHENLELSWLKPLLQENTIIKGFKISEKPYTYIHQNLFQSKFKLTRETSRTESLFILDYTRDKKDKLYLCKKRSFNPLKFRLVLKSHEENQIIGIINVDIIDKKPQIKIPVSDYRIGHVLFKESESRNYDTLSDYHLNNFECQEWSTLPSKKHLRIEWFNERVSRVNSLKNKMFPVTIESYFRVKFRSCLNRNNTGWREVFSVIGPDHATEFKKTKDGLKSYFGSLKIPFDFLKDEYCPNQTRIEFDENALEPTNVYLSTHTSKKGGLYIKVRSYNYSDFLTYNYGFDTRQGWAYGYEEFEEYHAEWGYPSHKIEKEWQELLEKGRISQAEEKSSYQNDRYLDDYDAYADTDMGDPRGWW